MINCSKKEPPSPYADHDHVSTKVLSGQREQCPGWQFNYGSKLPSFIYRLRLRMTYATGVLGGVLPLHIYRKSGFGRLLRIKIYIFQLRMFPASIGNRTGSGLYRKGASYVWMVFQIVFKILDLQYRAVFLLSPFHHAEARWRYLHQLQGTEVIYGTE